MILSEKMIAAWIAMMILAAVAVKAQTPVWFWDMETENATIYTAGSDNTPTYAYTAARSDAEAYEGSWSLDCGGTWAAATFDNNTNNVVWAPVTEGTIEFYWQYHAPWGDMMLFQMTGKSSTKDPVYDTNDGIGVRTRGGDEGEFFSGTARNLYHGITLVEGRWYRFIVRYKSDRGISLQIDDSPEYTSAESSFGPTECLAWHQILIGNDRGSTGMKQNIDNFAVYDHWVEDFTTGMAPLQYTQQIPLGLHVVVGPNPMHGTITFDAGSKNITGIAIYNQSGNVVETIHESSLQNMPVPSWSNHTAPAGRYYYRINTTTGFETGSFIKSE